MVEPKTPEPASNAQRERQILRSVESLFRRCETSAEPILAYRRAQGKIAYLAGDGVRGALTHIESALCERRHALLAAERGQTEQATEHHRDCGRDLQSFQRAIRREIHQPHRALSTPELTERIRRNLEVGQWRRAALDIDAALERTDLVEHVPRLDTYLSAQRLTPERFAQLKAHVDRYNRAVDPREQQRLRDVDPTELSTPRLRARIHEQLTTSQWSEAHADLQELASRPDIGKPLPELGRYPGASTLPTPDHAQLSAGISRCNALAQYYLETDLAEDRARRQGEPHWLPRHLSTPQLRARIDEELTTGRWDHARVDLNELARRPDIGRPLPAVDGYPLVQTLSLAQREGLESRVDRCDDNARAQRGQASLTKQPAQAVRAHVDSALRQGDWDLARLALNELARRPSIGVSLPELDRYPRVNALLPEQQDALRSRISRCNARAEDQNHYRAWRGRSPHPDYEQQVRRDVAGRMQALDAARAAERVEVDRRMRDFMQSFRARRAKERQGLER